jgi:hypothetical protein
LIVVVVVAASEQSLLGALEHPLGLAAGSTLGHAADHLGEGLLVANLVEVEPVDRLGEPEVGVDAGDHDPRVDRKQLDSDERDPHEDINHDPLV